MCKISVGVKITRTLLEAYFYKKETVAGGIRECTLLCWAGAGGRGAPAKAQPHCVPWRYWTVSPQVARGTRGVDVPKAKSSTRRDLDQLEDQATRHQVLCDKQQHHRGVPLEPSDARHRNGQDEQQPCPNGHDAGGVLGTDAVHSLQIRKKPPTNFNNWAAFGGGPAAYSLCSVLGRSHLDSVPCFAPLVWEGQSKTGARECVVGWGHGACWGGVGQVWQAKRRRRGSSCCCLNRSNRGDGAEPPSCSGCWERSGAGWAAALPGCCQGCHSSGGVLPATAQVLLGPGWDWLGLVCFCHPHGVRRGRAAVSVEVSSNSGPTAAPRLYEKGASRAVSGLWVLLR